MIGVQHFDKEWRRALRQSPFLRLACQGMGGARRNFGPFTELGYKRNDPGERTDRS